MKKTLVLGASNNPTRYSNMAIEKLVKYGHTVVAIGLRSGTVAGIEILTDKLAFDDINTVTMYISPRRQPEYYDYLVSLKPERILFNPGTENPEFYKILEKNGIEVNSACTLVLLSSQQY